jgi:hypothetical protein
MVSDLCSVLINEWIKWESRTGLFFQGQGWAVFDEHMETLFACPPAI